MGNHKTPLRLSFLALLSCTITAALLTPPTQAQAPADEPVLSVQGRDVTPPPADFLLPPDKSHMPLSSSRLSEIYTGWQDGERSFPEVSNGALQIEINHTPGQAKLTNALKKLSATDIVPIIDTLTAATVPVEQLVAIESLSIVESIQLPVDLSIQIEPEDVVDTGESSLRDIDLIAGTAKAKARGKYGVETVQRTRVAPWHRAGITGKGVRVGIIDGFKKSVWDKSAKSKDVPKKPAGTYCLSKGKKCNVWKSGGEHGVGVAEAIHDIAPSAKLYLVSVDSLADYKQAIQWLKKKKVKIISRSLGAQFDGPGDGTGPSAKVLDYAVKNGMIWFNSAGNHGIQKQKVDGDTYNTGGYWRGKWRDEFYKPYDPYTGSPLIYGYWANIGYGADGILDFSHPMLQGGSPYLQMYCGYFQGLRWNDWGKNRTDYDLYAVWTDGSPELKVTLISGNNQQNGAKPLEVPDPNKIPCSYDGTVGIVVYLAHPGNGTGNDTLELMTNSAFKYDVSNAGSAGQPFADTKSKGGISVGAFDVRNGKIKDFSSRGPLNDKRTKPDISASSDFKSMAYQKVDGTKGRFSGTSAATPVAAGMAALLYQKYPKWSPAKMKKYILSHVVRSRGTSKSKLNQFGKGEIRAPLLNTKKPKVSGKLKVGKKLKVKKGKWSEKVKLKYQWLRNGKKIKKATKKTYKLTKKDRKKKISVREYASKKTYKKVAATSKRTKKIS